VLTRVMRCAKPHGTYTCGGGEGRKGSSGTGTFAVCKVSESRQEAMKAAATVLLAALVSHVECKGTPTAVGSSVASVGGVYNTHNYTFYKADGPDCAGAVVVKTNVLGNCTFSVAGIGSNDCGGRVVRLACDGYGNLLSYFYSPRGCGYVSPAALAEQLGDCRSGISAPDTRLISWQNNGKCTKEPSYINGTEKEIYSKATWSC